MGYIKNLDYLTPEKNYPVIDPYAPKHLFRMLISGSSGSGKTNLALGLILEKLYFDKLYLYCKSLSQAKWEYLKGRIEKLADKANVDIDEIFYCSDDVTKIKPLDELDKEKVNLVIFDDLLLDQSPLISKYFIQSRHRSCSLIFLTQSYYSTDKLIRNNCTHYCFFSTNKRNLDLIANDLSGATDHKVFIKIFKDIMKQDPYGYMVLDILNKDRTMRIRNQFDGPITIPEDQA